MEERIGFIGKYKGHKIFYDGLVYFCTIDNRTYALDERKIKIERLKLA